MRVRLKPNSQKRLGQEFVMLSQTDVDFVVGEYMDDKCGYNGLILSDQSRLKQDIGVLNLDVYPLNKKQYKFFAPDQYEFIDNPLTQDEIDSCVVIMVKLDMCDPPHGFDLKKLRDARPALR